MVTVSKQNPMSSASLSGPSGGSMSNGRSLFRIVSFACIAGFLLDIIALAFPLKLGELAWRVGFLQQIGDRSIILLLGLVFLMLGSLEMRNLRKQVAMVSLGLGLAFMLCGVIGIKDAVSLQKQTSTNITAQSTQLQERIQQAKEKPPANAKVTPELIDQAMKQVTDRTADAQKTAQTQILKTGLSSVGNLFIVGLAMIGIGRYGMRVRG
jgi:predicted PurR-regulated permease PerM